LNNHECVKIMDMNFRSDNESPAAPAIIEALLEANNGTAWAYAEDQWSERLDAAFSELFGTQTTVLPVSTGTVANSIALASVTPPWGLVYCHRNAHILNDECGAPEFFGSGLRLVPVDGPDGMFNPSGLRAAVNSAEGFGIHSYVSSAVSITQSNECGTVYQAEEISSICDAAKQLGLTTHMDGARFGNAVASLGCHPGEISWQAGIDMMSFGASKNGCLAAEALIFFNRTELRETAERHRKQAAHFSYAVGQHPSASLEFPVHANEVFVKWSPEGFSRLEKAGIQFLGWPGRDDLARFVFSHCTGKEETEQLCSALADIEDC
jgi:threonine aldolase